MKYKVGEGYKLFAIILVIAVLIILLAGGLQHIIYDIFVKESKQSEEIKTPILDIHRNYYNGETTVYTSKGGNSGYIVRDPRKPEIEPIVKFKEVNRESLQTLEREGTIVYFLDMGKESKIYTVYKGEEDVIGHVKYYGELGWVLIMTKEEDNNVKTNNFIIVYSEIS